jgi:aquaporin Z
MRKLVGEALGTFMLVFGGCGAAVFSARIPFVGIGFLGVALAFGLSVLAGVYAIGPISGAHFNPAVSFGLAVGGRFSWKEVPGYVAAQLMGALVGAGLVLAIASGQPGGYDAHTSGLAANGFGAHSPGHFSLGAGLLAEMALSFVFVGVILGATARDATTPQAGIAIGLTLTLVHLVGIPITNTSVNPARSTGPALFVGGWALGQLWLFWLAPLAGAAMAGGVARLLFARTRIPSEAESSSSRSRGSSIPVWSPSPEPPPAR